MNNPIRIRINNMIQQIAKHDRLAANARDQGEEDVAKANLHLSKVFAEQIKILRQLEKEK